MMRIFITFICILLLSPTIIILSILEAYYNAFVKNRLPFNLENFLMIYRKKYENTYNINYWYVFNSCSNIFYLC